MIIAVLISSLVWFILAAILFFNPIIDKVYSSEEHLPAVKALPKNAKTIGNIYLAVLLQCILWVLVYGGIKACLPISIMGKTLAFGTILVFLKMIPRDIDRLLLTTYPKKRMFIEFLIGVICSYTVALTFAYLQ